MVTTARQLDILRTPGWIFYSEDKLEEAEKFMERSFEMYIRLYGDGKDHRNISVALDDLGWVKEERGLLKEAEKKYRESLSILHRLLGSSINHRSIAMTMSKLASVQRRLGSFSDAEQMFEKCLQMQLRLNRSQDCLQLADTMNNMALVSMEQGKLENTELRLRESLAIYQRIFSESADTINTKRTMGNLVEVLRR